MISLKNRFRGHNSLRGVYQKGKSAYSTNLKILWLPSTGDSYRAAVVVSKKVHKSAVVRNRIRRRVYEHIRLFMNDNPKNVDIIFVAQNEAPAHAPAQQVAAEVLPLLKKTIGVL